MGVMHYKTWSLHVMRIRRTNNTSLLQVREVVVPLFFSGAAKVLRLAPVHQEKCG